jgi:hypothetical protein
MIWSGLSCHVSRTAGSYRVCSPRPKGARVQRALICSACAAISGRETGMGPSSDAAALHILLLLLLLLLAALGAAGDVKARAAPLGGGGGRMTRPGCAKSAVSNVANSPHATLCSTTGARAASSFWPIGCNSRFLTSEPRSIPLQSASKRRHDRRQCREMIQRRSTRKFLNGKRK